ncbi:MAG TPA: hypothetical protein VGF94_13425 [Kofleriaceae bacterium]|jgi:hypothetical protein
MHRSLAGWLAGCVVAAGCGTTTYEIPRSELVRLAAVAPDQRGRQVRVVQQLSDTDVGPVQPVYENTQVVLFPQPWVNGPDRRRYSESHWNGNVGNLGSSGGGHASGGHGGGGLHLSGGGGSGKGEAIVILAAAAIVLFASAAVEGSRYDGYAQLHPMQPVYLFGKDGEQTVMPLAWIDPDTAQWADRAIVRSSEGPFRELGRAPLDRAGFTYAMLGGLGGYKSLDGSVANGPAATIQFGYFFDQQVGLVGTAFFGWRDNATAQTLFDSRYTVELQGYPVQLGRVHLGLYGGGGMAYRWEDYGPNTYGDGSTALVGGALVQLDINTRLALTGRLGVTDAHDELMTDALFGLSVY